MGSNGSRDPWDASNGSKVDFHAAAWRSAVLVSTPSRSKRHARQLAPPSRQAVPRVEFAMTGFIPAPGRF